MFFFVWSYIFQDGPVTSERINAALCLYFIAGLIWAFFYLVMYDLKPESFNIKGADLDNFIYYSFITLSTLGYGDITPLSPTARAFSYVEAVLGQIYLAVIIARIVSLHLAFAKLPCSKP